MNVKIIVNNTEDIERFITELVANYPQHVLSIEGVDGFPPQDNRIPKGKGMLIWQLAKTAGGNMKLMAEQAKDAGFKWVSIKVVENGNLYNPTLINDAVKELRAVGISVRGWGYIYPTNVIAQAQKTAKIVNDLGLDGYEMDIEQEWKVGNLVTQATQYAQTLKLNLNPYVGIGLCSYRYPNLHPLPWKEFLAVCDYHAPQVYWAGATTDTAPQGQLVKSHDQLIALKNIPFVPIGVSAPMPIGTVVWKPTVAQLNNFYMASLQSGYAMGYYDWTSAFAEPTWWNAIKAQA